MNGICGMHFLQQAMCSIDYLRYKSIQDTKDLGADTILREETDEIPDDGADSERAKYR